MMDSGEFQRSPSLLEIFLRAMEIGIFLFFLMQFTFKGDLLNPDNLGITLKFRLSDVRFGGVKKKEIYLFQGVGTLFPDSREGIEKR